MGKIPWHPNQIVLLEHPGLQFVGGLTPFGRDDKYLLAQTNTTEGIHYIIHHTTESTSLFMIYVPLASMALLVESDNILFLWIYRYIYISYISWPRYWLMTLKWHVNPCKWNPSCGVGIQNLPVFWWPSNWSHASRDASMGRVLGWFTLGTLKMAEPENWVSFGGTYPKTNMEPGNTTLEKEKHLQTTNFWVPCLFWGV